MKQLMTDHHSAYQPHPLVNVAKSTQEKFFMLTVQLLMS